MALQVGSGRGQELRGSLWLSVERGAFRGPPLDGHGHGYCPVPIFIAIILHARFANGAAHFVILFGIINFRGIPWAALLVGDGDGSVWPYVLENSNLLPLGFHLGDLSISRSL